MRAFFFLISLAFFLQIAAFANPFISPEEIHPGMVGYGKTVFQGTKIETFPVVVLGVLRNAIPGSEIILIKIKSPYLDKRHLGVVGGMSGSPVYFHGKLAGAIAYGWPFLREPIAGVTPIASMLALSRMKNTKNSSVGFPESIETIHSRNQSNLGSVPENQPSFLPIPLVAGGLNPGGIEKIQALFPGLQVISGGSLIQMKQVPPLQPGAAVGVALMEGDVNLMASGTLTYLNGADALAFGHPFLTLGHVHLPFYQSYVHAILPSLEEPTRLSSPVQEVGEILQDRLYGVSGKLHHHPGMTPMEIRVTDRDQNFSHTFHVNLASMPQLTPRLAAIALDQAIPAVTKAAGEGTALVDCRLTFAHEPPLRRRTTVLSKSSVSDAVSAEILHTLRAVAANDFQPVELRRIRVNISMESKLAVATLEKVVIQKHHLKPGEPLHVTAILHPYNQPAFRKDFSVKIPPDVSGSVQVGIAGGEFEEELRHALDQPPPEPQNLQETLRKIQNIPSADSLILRLAFPRKAVTWDGEELSNFPVAYANLVKQTEGPAIAVQPDGKEWRIQTPWVVNGSIVETVTVGSPTNNESAEAPLEPLSGAKRSKEERTRSLVLSQPKDWKKGTMEGLSISANGSLSLAPEEKVSARFPGKFLWAIAGSPKAISGTVPGTKNARSGTVPGANNAEMGTVPGGIMNGSHQYLPCHSRLGRESNNQRHLWIPASARMTNGIDETRSIYIGTWNPGKILRIQNGKTAVFFNSRTKAISSLLLLPNGDLLAGTFGGQLFRLDSRGTVKNRWKFPEAYIWQLARSGSRIYVGTGNPAGTLYQLDLQSTGTSMPGTVPNRKNLGPGTVPGGIQEKNSVPQLLFRSQESHLLSLYVFPDGRIFAGTGNHATLVEIQPNGKKKIFPAFPSDGILSLTGDSRNNLYLGTANQGTVYRLDPENRLEKIARFSEKEITWLGMKGDNLLVGTGIPARVYSVNPEGKVSLLWNGNPDEQTALKGTAEADSPPALLASGASGKLFTLLPELARKGIFLSNVLDTGIGSIAGTVRFSGSSPAGTAILVQTRSGNTPVPDAAWSFWSAGYPPSGASRLNPDARYFQFRATLSRGQSTDTPTLETLQAFYQPQRHPPVVIIDFPNPGDALGKNSRVEGELEEENQSVVKLSLQALYPGKEEILKEQFLAVSSGKNMFSVQLGSPSKQGPFALKLLVQNEPEDLPVAEKNPELFIKDLIFDSTPPTLTIARVEVVKKFLEIEGEAQDSVSYVKRVEFKLGENPWIEAVSSSGIFDAPKGKFTIHSEIPEGVKGIEIRAVDAAGNETTVRKSLP